MSVPTRSDPKRLSDYFGGWAKRHPKAAPRPGTRFEGGGYVDEDAEGRRFAYGVNTEQGKRTTAMMRATGKMKSAKEAPITAAERNKNRIMKNIEDSDKRRKALEAMWKAEKDAVTRERKAAIEEYKGIMETEPDFKDDDEGTQRAAWNNQPHVKAAKEKIKAHIEASMQQSNPARVDVDASGKKTITNRPRRPEQAKSKPGDPAKGDTQTIGNVKVTFSGEVIGKGGQEYLMGTDENGNRVGVPRAELAKGKKTDPEVEPTGEEYVGSPTARKAARGLIATATDERVPFTP